jgi:hypothetical protein
MCVGLAAIAALIRYPQAVSELGDRARDNAALSYADREVGGGNSVLPTQEIVYQARTRIPEDGTYEVAVGGPAEGWTELTGDHAAGFALSFLLPRRQVPGAPWLLCFDCDLAEGGEVVWRGEGNVSIVRREP